jgi:hypothetical protein
MLTVVRFADGQFAAYCLETGFCVYGNARIIAAALSSHGFKKHEILALSAALSSPPAPAEELDIPLILTQALRPKLRTRQT